MKMDTKFIATDKKISVSVDGGASEIMSLLYDILSLSSKCQACNWRCWAKSQRSRGKFKVNRKKLIVKLRK